MRPAFFYFIWRMMELFSKVLQAILEAALPMLVSAALVWMTGKCVELFKRLQDKNPELYEILCAITNKAVLAAEQIWGSENGQQKKAYAMDIVEKYLAAKGINLDLDIISAAIEAEVKQMNDTGELFKELDDELAEAEVATAVKSDELPASANHVCKDGVCSLN